MPDNPRKKYFHKRQFPPKKCAKGTTRTVPISHTNLKTKFRKKGTKAVVCRVKGVKKGRKWKVQSVLIPKK